MEIMKLAGSSKDNEFRDKMLKAVKKEVKQIMEEAVTRKFVHEESSTITSLCAAVEACLSHGLKRRTLGLFKTSSTTALVHKIGKNFAPAHVVSQLVTEIENTDPNKKSSSSSDSTNKSKSISKKISSTAKYLWIRVALIEKQLSKIIDYLVRNCSKYYEKDALVSDPVSGPILASLLVGPCALDYSKMKTQDHFWTDPPADELVQRHRLSNICPSVPSTPPTGRRPGLNFRKPFNAGSSEEASRSLPFSARDYVDSLHQNSKAALLYGKNNVLVQPKENTEPLPGYLSLHQIADTLTIKWTPNQLMNGCCGENSSNDSVTSKEEKRCLPRPRSFFRQTSKSNDFVYWDYAINVNVDEIVYVHCHQQANIGGTVVLVGQDGIQYPPIHFPKGGHLLSFLSCMENGLLPHGQLDPPLWSQRGKGKVFPKLKRRAKLPVAIDDVDASIAENEDNEESSDYVFRILNHIKPDTIVVTQEMMDPKYHATNGWPLRETYSRSSSDVRHCSTRTSSRTSSSKSLSLTEDNSEISYNTNGEHTGVSLQVLCDTMRRQIISRAFYGWLAHCRHLRTVRTHLSGLVCSTVVSIEEPCDASKGLTIEYWHTLKNENKVENAMEVYRLTYFGGVQHELRKEVWPYLLGYYKFGSTLQEREELDLSTHQKYEHVMSEWLAVEAIVRQRDKENMAAQQAKLSSESTNDEIPLIGRDQTLSNEVFEDSISIASDEIQDLCEENLEVSAIASETTNNEENIEAAEIVDQDLDKMNVGKSHLETNECVDEQINIDVAECPDKQINIGVAVCEETKKNDTLIVQDFNEGVEDAHAICMSPASSNGGIYTAELLDSFALNLHRIDKDVQRCDRNYKYFVASENLEKLRNIMCTYVWEHLSIGYVQGMCDLVAPLLVIFDDESLTYNCFCQLMKRMSANFPHGGAMDSHFTNMRSLIQIFDSEMFELMHQNGDYTHFYFCYRWFLLDFKRELLYEDVFCIWETIWAAHHVASVHFVLFIALAFVEFYRDIILDNNMNFTDVIKFFNEMAEDHDAQAILNLAQDLVLRLQKLIDNK